MKRNVSLAEISDGRLYGIHDMVKADCHGCAGCSQCCQGMGTSIILDPLDVYNLTKQLGKPFQDFINHEVELNVVDGVILPNLKMTGKAERCAFLNKEGRCSIHPFRPGICRLFPLGRYYENGGFRYFLQTGECTQPHTKIKVSKWIDTPDLKRNQEFILCWHNLLNQMEEILAVSEDDGFQRSLNLFLLNTFYMAPYDGEEDFYSQFDKRVKQLKSVIESADET